MELRIFAVTNKGQPVEKLAIGISRRPRSAPDVGGEQYTNKEGLAVFNLKPGKYYLGVDSESIPSNLEYGTNPFQIIVQEGKVTNKRLFFIQRKIQCFVPWRQNNVQMGHMWEECHHLVNLLLAQIQRNSELVLG